MSVAGGERHMHTCSRMEGIIQYQKAFTWILVQNRVRLEPTQPTFPTAMRHRLHVSPSHALLSLHSITLK